jgi:hypothetical protein
VCLGEGPDRLLDRELELVALVMRSTFGHASKGRTTTVLRQVRKTNCRVAARLSCQANSDLIDAGWSDPLAHDTGDVA